MKRQRQKEVEAVFIDVLLLLLTGKSWTPVFYQYSLSDLRKRDALNARGMPSSGQILA